MKTTEQQERQLADLLDAVPDNVFICRKDTNEGSQTLRGIYANHRMHEFFGRNVLSFEERNDKRMKRGKCRKKKN